MSSLHQEQPPSDASRLQPTIDSPAIEPGPVSSLKSGRSQEVPSPTKSGTDCETPSHSPAPSTRNLETHIASSAEPSTAASINNSQSVNNQVPLKPAHKAYTLVRNATGLQRRTVRPVSSRIEDLPNTPPQSDLHPIETKTDNQVEATATNVQNDSKIIPASAASQLDETKTQPIESQAQTSPGPELGSSNGLPSTDVSAKETPSQQHVSTTKVSVFMSLHDAVLHLGVHGCINLTQQLDEGSFGIYPTDNGGFGDIYRGKLKDGRKIAIKAIRLRMNSNEEDQKALKHAARELYTWSKCQHANVQRLLGLVEFRNQIGMVSAWESNGNLSSYIRQHPDVNRCQLSAQVAEGLAYLHDVGIVHGDLKASNVLVSEYGVPLLIDFGNSTLKEYSLRFSSTSSTSSVSVRWAAPEMLDGTDTRSIPADIYALGMTILEIISGNIPWLGKTDISVMASVFMKQMHPERPIIHIPYASKHGDALWNMLKKCWSREPTTRPSAKQVKAMMQSTTSQGLTAAEGQTSSTCDIGLRTSKIRSRSPTPNETQEPGPKRVRYD